MPWKLQIRAENFEYRKRKKRERNPLLKDFQKMPWKLQIRAENFKYRNRKKRERNSLLKDFQKMLISLILRYFWSCYPFKCLDEMQHFLSKQPQQAHLLTWTIIASDVHIAIKLIFYQASPLTQTLCHLSGQYSCGSTVVIGLR